MTIKMSENYSNLPMTIDDFADEVCDEANKETQEKAWECAAIAINAYDDNQARIKELEIKLAKHETKINCWSCGKTQSLHQHADNDGFCIRCDTEIELGLG